MRFYSKLNTLYKKTANYFYYSGRDKIIDPINPIYHLRKHYERESREKIESDSELSAILHSMLAKSDSTGCEFGDYYELYRSIRSLKPKCVLECGSGISSGIIAYSLKQLADEFNHTTTFVSMEENPFYHDQVKTIFPDSLRPYVSFVLAEREENKFGSLWGCFYKEVPDYPYDFVFIDGPTERKDSRSPKCFNADFIQVVEKTKNPVVGLLDQRVTTYWALKSLMTGAKIRYSVVKKVTTITADRNSFGSATKMQRREGG